MRGKPVRIIIDTRKHRSQLTHCLRGDDMLSGTLSLRAQTVFRPSLRVLFRMSLRAQTRNLLIEASPPVQEMAERCPP